MPKHIARLIALLCVLGAAGLAAKAYFTAHSFYRYGHYRGDAVAEIASDKPKYEDPESCRSCHAERYAEWSRGVHDSAAIHKVVRCEVCHGAGGGRDDKGMFRHSATGPRHPVGVTLAVPTDTVALCTHCHSKDPARPAEQRQIVRATHGESKPCWSCHNPHSPKLLVGAAAPAAQHGDATAGEAKAAMCAGCHGAHGVSTNLPGPSLAAQNEAYLIEALDAYRSGARDNPIMGALAKGLSDSDIRNAAAYFSGLSCKRPPQAHAQTVSAVQGAASKCTACHGGTGVSGNPQWPNLAGQSKAYLIGALQAYKGGGRKNSIMNGIAKDLSDAEAERAAGFFALARCE
ncbi:MAG TPA: c-type cytochrome [Burkholderiales bacterium]|nr:c-type cytochrome [Burkholderiales bacterium]